METNLHIKFTCSIHIKKGWIFNFIVSQSDMIPISSLLQTTAPGQIDKVVRKTFVSIWYRIVVTVVDCKSIYDRDVYIRV